MNLYYYPWIQSIFISFKFPRSVANLMVAFGHVSFSAGVLSRIR